MQERFPRNVQTDDRPSKSDMYVYMYTLSYSMMKKREYNVINQGRRKWDHRYNAINVFM